MVSDIEKLYKMRDYSNQLSKGIDPTSGIAFPDDSIMNISKIKNHNKEVYLNYLHYCKRMSSYHNNIGPFPMNSIHFCRFERYIYL